MYSCSDHSHVQRAYSTCSRAHRGRIALDRFIRACTWLRAFKLELELEAGLTSERVVAARCMRGCERERASKRRTSVGGAREWRGDASALRMDHGTRRPGLRGAGVEADSPTSCCDAMSYAWSRTTNGATSCASTLRTSASSCCDVRRLPSASSWIPHAPRLGASASIRTSGDPPCASSRSAASSSRRNASNRTSAHRRPCASTSCGGVGHPRSSASNRRCPCRPSTTCDGETTKTSCETRKACEKSRASTRSAWRTSASPVGRPSPDSSS
jgi:hypothetical protein